MNQKLSYFAILGSVVSIVTGAIWLAACLWPPSIENWFAPIMLAIWLWHMSPYLLLLGWLLMPNRLIAGIAAITFAALNLIWYWVLVPPSVAGRLELENLLHPVFIWILGIIVLLASVVVVIAGRKGLQNTWQIAMFFVLVGIALMTLMAVGPISFFL